MTRYRLSSAAERDLLEAWLYIASDSYEAADRVLDVIRDKLELVAQHPHIGELRPDLNIEAVRSVLAGAFVIYYRPASEIIEVARILHVSRDVRSLNR